MTGVEFEVIFDDGGDFNVSFDQGEPQSIEFDEEIVINGGGGGASSLSDLDDVDLSSPSDGQVLGFDADSGKWTNQNAGGGAVDSVNGQTGTVVLDAGDLGYDENETYSSGTVGDAITDLKSDLNSNGITDDLRDALLQLAAHVAYIDDDGQDYYDALEAALYPPAELVSISAVYTQSGTVYPSTSLDDLKTDLVVTALYDDTTTETITTYTLSGTLTTGTSTITVSYGGKTTTFDVTVTDAPSEEVWIQQNGASGRTAAFNYSPFVLPTDTYTYDYTKKISAIEATFSGTGSISVGYCSVGSPSGAFDSSTITYVETLTVPSVGSHKLTLSTPLEIPSGYSLVIGKNSDTALFAYGGSLTSGFLYKDNNNAWKIQNMKLGFDIYRI